MVSCVSRDREVLEEIAENRNHSEWKIVRVVSRSEHLASQELTANGFESYCPRVIVGHPNKMTYTPLFPGYIFARKACHSENPHPIYMLPHVYGWVGFDGNIPSVPQHIVSDLQCRVSDINADGGLWHKYEIGDLVKVTLCGVDTLGTVTLAPETPEKPINILLDFMGREVRAQVSIERVNPIKYNFNNASNIPRRSRGRGRWTKQYRDLQKVNPEISQESPQQIS